MGTHLSAPQIDDLIARAKGDPAVFGEEEQAALLQLFAQLKIFAACGEDERRELWLTANRGTIEDYGDFEEYVEEGEVETYEEFEALWIEYYPEPLKWYPLTAMSSSGIYSVFLDHKLVLQLMPHEQNEFPYEKTELIEWLSSVVKDCAQAVKVGTYNDYVEHNLPAHHRVGKILREDYWRVFPEGKAAYLEHISSEEVETFTALMQSQPKDCPDTRLSEMSAGFFFDCCRLGYEANNYTGVGELSPRELYQAHADRRHDGLLDLPDDSAEAFAAWLANGPKGGHPWEVCRGGNSTHISLYPHHDERGWWLSLAGSSYVRSVETIKFYLSLAEHGVPIFLYNGPALATMVTGKDYIGIVPEGIFPRYCDAWFPKEDGIIDYMNLPWEKAEAVTKAASWYPLEQVALAASN